MSTEQTTGEQPEYSKGGVVESAVQTSQPLADDECVVVPRDGVWKCVRDHETHRGFSGAPAVDYAAALRAIAGVQE